MVASKSGLDPAKETPDARLAQFAIAGADRKFVWADAHIAVLPSRREGLPKSLLEAAACARPLVATDMPGCRDIVIPGETGLLVPPGDPSALADALRRLAEDPALRARLGTAARERAAALFGHESVVAATLAVYRELSPAAP